ncbi:OmpA family protein [Puia sp. P3]|uniref:OmpA family protein n=1 Tax=Puia sp. P3 TaxID=3423952 RepID=UPI003D6686D3
MKKTVHFLACIVVSTSLLTSCVSSGRYHASLSALESARNDSARLATQVAQQKANIDKLNGQVSDLNGQVDGLNKKVDDLTNRTGQLSTESANRQKALSKSQQELAANQKRLEELQALMDQQKRAILDIRKKMSDALVGFNSKDLQVSIKNGKVYVSLSENLLFPSGSAVVNPKGKEALGKLAGVLNNNNDITVMIEGHTDSIPIHGRYQDNWDLSTARATSIVRILTKDYMVDPVRVEASGHSSYDPVQTNATTEGRALNRRTEIILSPRLDELYRLIESSPAGATSKN